MIEVEHICLSFGKRKILEDVNLTVYDGETMVILGASGSGKSTLLKLIIGLLKPDSGSIKVNGKEISSLTEREMNEERRRMGMVCQYSALFDSMNVKENVAFGLRQHTDLSEEEIENILRHDEELARPTGEKVGFIRHRNELAWKYKNYILSTVKGDFKGMKIVTDSANGAASGFLPDILRELGAEITALYCEPNGVNINKDCGSTHMETLQKMVVEMGADCGIANDGDADRCLFVDEQGYIMDGDHLMVINALRMKKEGRLNANMVVGTVMSNLGFGKALAEHGCRTVATNVGDRYVLEEMKAHEYSLGGEQSGHIIFPEFNTTGDGLITAVQTLMVLRDHDGPLSELNHLMTTYPQLLKNVKVYSKNGWEENEQIRAAVEAAKDELGNDGRILVRASGTEPLIRVMGEGSDKDRLERVIDDIVSVVEQELGEE